MRLYKFIIKNKIIWDNIFVGCENINFVFGIGVCLFVSIIVERIGVKSINIIFL